MPEIQEFKTALFIQKPGGLPERPNMGDEAWQILKAGGLTTEKESRVDFEKTNIPGIYLWPRRNGDIARTIMRDGGIGIVGEDKLGELDWPIDPQVLKVLDFSACTLRAGVTERHEFGPNNDRPFEKPSDLIDKVISTSYVKGTGRWLDRNGVPWVVENGIHRPKGYATVREEEGGAESVAYWGTAQAAVEIVQSGSSMKANRLIQLDDVLTSRAVLIANPNLGENEKAQYPVWRVLNILMDGIYLTQYKMMKLNYPKSNEAEILRALPARKEATVSNLKKRGWLAAEALVPLADYDTIKEQLLDLGAEDIFRVPIEDMTPNRDDDEVNRMMIEIFKGAWTPPEPYRGKGSNRFTFNRMWGKVGSIIRGNNAITKP